MVYLLNPSGNTFSEKINEFGIRHTMLINALFISEVKVAYTMNWVNMLSYIQCITMVKHAHFSSHTYIHIKIFIIINKKINIEMFINVKKKAKEHSRDMINLSFKIYL